MSSDVVSSKESISLALLVSSATTLCYIYSGLMSFSLVAMVVVSTVALGLFLLSLIIKGSAGIQGNIIVFSGQEELYFSL